MAGTIRRQIQGVLGAEALRTLVDNLLRVVVMLLLIGPRRTEADVQRATAAVNVAYTVPWIALSLLAGGIADRVSKTYVIRTLKVLEVVGMLLAAWVFARGDEWGLLAVVALVGTLSATASPAKYGILPELLPSSDLARGDGLLLLWTYAAMISGTALGGILLDLLRPVPWTIGLLLALLAAVGVRLAWRIPVVPAARGTGGLVSTVRDGLRAIRGDLRLRLGLGGNVLYWALAALVGQDLIVYAKTVLGLSDTGKGLLLTALAIGVGVGAALAGLASRGRVRLGQVPLGAAFMAASAGAFGLLVPSFGLALLLLVGLGMGAGFFAVPITALIQTRSPASARGSVLAVMNVVIFAGTVLGSLVAWGLAAAGLDSPTILLVAAVVLAAGALYAGIGVPLRLRREGA